MKRYSRIAIVLALVLVFALVVGVAPALAKAQSNSGAPATVAAPHVAKAFNPSLITCMPLSGPFMGTKFMYNFQGDTTPPSYFPDGGFYGIQEIDVVGSTWATWRPQVTGKHLAYCYSSGATIWFYQPVSVVGVVAEPNTMNYQWLEIDAYDVNDNLIGIYWRWVNGNAGANFLGLASQKDNISYVEVYGSDSFCFSDLQYRWAAGGTWKFWVPPAFI